MKKTKILLILLALFGFGLPLKADFGDAAFPIDFFKEGPQSYHDGWCRALKKKCRIRFQGPAMWVEGQGGIQRDQFIEYRFDEDYDGPGFFSVGSNDFYNYITYRSKNGQRREALFLFSNYKAQVDFIRAFTRWRKQVAKPIPNYRLPNSQGPQDTQGRDKGLNPYDNPPITDWSEKTTKESPAGINCDSMVWRNKPECMDY